LVPLESIHLGGFSVRLLGVAGIHVRGSMLHAARVFHVIWLEVDLVPHRLVGPNLHIILSAISLSYRDDCGGVLKVRLIIRLTA